MNEKTNFYKWLVFSFPYLVLLFHKVLAYSLFEFFSFTMEADTDDLILTLLNSTAILFGIKLLSNFTLIRNLDDNLSSKNFLKSKKS